MTPLDIAQQYLDAWNQHDSAAIVACFAAGGTYHDPAAGILTGAAIGDYADMLFAAFPDLSFDIVSAAALADDRVVVEWCMRGTNRGSFAGAPATGRTIALPGVDIISVDGGAINSLRGYFDQRILVEQLGLQVVVQPNAIGPFTFGRSTRVHVGNQATPGALSLTWIDVCTEAEHDTVLDYSRQLALEMTQMPGFISWIGITIGERMYTLTAWEDVTNVEQLRRHGVHREAVQRVFGPDFASALHTSVWSPHHLNPLWLRCPSCDQMVNADRASDTCECGAAVPDRRPYL